MTPASRPRDRAALLCLLLAAMPAFAQSQSCPPSGWTRASLQAWKASGFALPDPAARAALAATLPACLGDPDPAMRDGIAYEALTHWLRAGDLDTGALRTLRDALYAMLDAPDPDGFRRPFAALVLSEVARTDRIRAWMGPEERDAMVARAADYLREVRDYRGFDDRDGWRHGVAHGADWLMQLSLNPALARPQYDRILAAVARQVPASGGYAYVDGEPGRLARPVLSAARRGLYSQAEWTAWFAALRAGLAPIAPGDIDRVRLAQRHNLRAFLVELYLEADRSEDAGVRALKPALADALKPG
ncbi:DUF2785 domain-containing protein [Luteimonas aquatica]|uniref:DUF2785 domain-containing protein n=1 Tax=Luteimonas aquatica TaxID=450364 RepID=UPI001F5A6527|nr:DUF2785 domain-containing protein [Luteimonas aquatica]